MNPRSALTAKLQSPAVDVRFVEEFPSLTSPSQGMVKKQWK